MCTSANAGDVTPGAVICGFETGYTQLMSYEQWIDNDEQRHDGEENRKLVELALWDQWKRELATSGCICRCQRRLTLRFPETDKRHGERYMLLCPCCDSKNCPVHQKEKHMTSVASVEYEILQVLKRIADTLDRIERSLPAD